jgi:coatomer subunit beta'
MVRKKTLSNYIDESFNLNQVYWSESDLVVIACQDSFYVLKFNRLAFQAALEQSGGNISGDEGVESAFEVLNEVNES